MSDEIVDFQFSDDAIDLTALDEVVLTDSDVQVELADFNLIDVDLQLVAGSYEWLDGHNSAELDFSVTGNTTTADFDGWATDGVGSGISGIFTSEA